MKKKQVFNLILLLVAILAYIILFIINKHIFYISIHYFWHIFLRVFYALIIVFVFIFLTNLFISPKSVIKYLGKESGIKGWWISVIAGIISTGSIYLWYPLLKELKEMGMRKGLIAVFLYNRAVKIPILPVMVYYFGWLYTLILTFYMVVFSVILGLIMEKVS